MAGTVSAHMSKNQSVCNSIKAIGDALTAVNTALTAIADGIGNRPDQREAQANAKGPGSLRRLALGLVQVLVTGRTPALPGGVVRVGTRWFVNFMRIGWRGGSAGAFATGFGRAPMLALGPALRPRRVVRWHRRSGSGARCFRAGKGASVSLCSAASGRGRAPKRWLARHRRGRRRPAGCWSSWR